jgi:hypothetical protein
MLFVIGFLSEYVMVHRDGAFFLKRMLLACLLNEKRRPDAGDISEEGLT